MHRVLIVFSIFLFSNDSYAAQLPSAWRVVGTADLKLLWFPIYSAQLKTPKGVFAGTDRSVLLSLEYHQDIEKAVLLRETEKSIKQTISPADRENLLSDLAIMWLDIQKGGRFAFLIDKDGYGHFFYNDGYLGSLDKPEMSQVIINIWLSDKSRYPDLAKQLRGE